MGAAAAGCEPAPPKESVSGTVRLSPALPPEARRTRILFIILEPEEGGPPLAVQRLVETKFPYRFVLTADDMMIAGRPFAGRVRVRARLDKDGRAGPFARGDYQGVSALAVAVGARDVEVVIDRAGTAEPQEAAERPAPPPPPPAAQAPAAGEKTITGTIVIAPHLASKAEGKPVLFLIARGERPGPPLAVLGVPNPRFPLRFTLSQENVMMPGAAFEGRVRLVARVDADGAAGPPQPGDLEGEHPGLVPVGAQGVTIVVDREY